MARLLIIAILLVPFVEIAVLIKVGQTIGLAPTLLLLVAAMVLGGVLLRLEGLSIVGQMHTSVSAGRLPGRTVADAMMIGLAALLLVLPGFLSDIAAIALLLPPVRTLVYRALASRVVVMDASTGGYPQNPRVRGSRTIDLDDEDYRSQ